MRREIARHELRPARLRHHDVGEQHVDVPRRRDLERLGGVARDEHGVAALLERAPREHAHVLRVLDDENRLGAARQLVGFGARVVAGATLSAAGSVMVNVVPSPGRAVDAIVPPD